MKSSNCQSHLNRADALSMRGVSMKPLQSMQNLFTSQKTVTEDIWIRLVAIESDKVATYASRVVENVTVQPSPRLQNLHESAGIRPINNVVDDKLCSFLYFGQLMHAFDLDKFEDSRIVARDARGEGEKLVTRCEERELTIEDIVITVADNQLPQQVR